MFAELAGAAGSLIGSALNYDSAQDQIEWQKQLAKHGIAMRVKDAQASGIHPLYALGAQVSSFSPVQAGDLSSSLGSAGQDIGRAIDAGMSAPEKVDAYTTQLRSLQLEKGRLENDMLRSQLVRMNLSPVAPAPTTGDPFLIGGQADSGVRPGVVGATSAVTDKPLTRTVSNPGSPWQEPGAITGVGWERTPTGWAPTPSADVKNRIEDSPMEWLWFLRNNIIPTFSGEGAKLRQPTWSPGAGREWYFNPWLQEYQSVPKFSRRVGPPTRSSGVYGHNF